MSIEFAEFQKIPRLSRMCAVTEKVDGTSGQIYIFEDLKPFVLQSARSVPFMVGSRSRWIFPENDNFGFAKWAYEHAEQLLQLGPGRHFGEWWGAGIQRKYGLSEKRFSLFAVHRWHKRGQQPFVTIPGDPRLPNKLSVECPECCHVVPVLYHGEFSTEQVEIALDTLRMGGSLAAPGFPKPEGVVVYHEAAGQYFKKTLDGDGAKGDR